MTLDSRRLRDAFGTFMTGVTVVTAMDESGQPYGFTANSFTSVSLDPPLLLVSIAKTSSNHAVFTSGRGFAVNILAENQTEISNTFARPAADRFANVNWRKGPEGSPVLADVAAWFDCAMHQVVEAGDHDILIGHVKAFEAGTHAGLGYSRGAYFTPSQNALAVASGPGVVISALIEAEDHVLLMDDQNGGLTVPVTRVGPEGAQAALARLIAETGTEAVPGFVYAVYEDVKRGHQHIAFLCQSQKVKPAKGVFVPLTTKGIADVTDPAMVVMLERLVDESRLGEYGLYFGNQDQGQVRRPAKGKNS